MSEPTPIALLAMVIEDCENYGIESGWYSDDLSSRRDVLGYAKQRLGHHSDAFEGKIPVLKEFAEVLGFTPDKRGLIRVTQMCDRYSSRKVLCYLRARLRKVTS